MKNSLVYISISTQFKSILSIVEFIINEKIAMPIFLLDNQVHELLKEAEYCKNREIEFFEINKNNTERETNKNKVQDINSLTVMTELKNILLFPYRTIKQIGIYQKKISWYVDFLEKNKIKTLLLTEQGLGYDVPFIMRASKKCKINLVVFPFAITTDVILKTNSNNPSLKFKRLSNKVLSHFLPRRAVGLYKNEKVLINLPPQIFALFFLKMLPKNPWSSYSGNADFINAESNYMKDFLLQEKIDKKQIIELGSFVFDNPKIENNYILCAFPPLSFNEDADLPEFSTNKSATTYWFNVLSRYSFDNKIVLHLHPRLNNNDFVDLAKKYNLEICNDAIENLIPMCKIFITSVSSIIRLAVAYGKPVLDYDIFGYNYPNYKNNEGVVTVFTKVDFENMLDKMVNDKKYYEEIKRKQLKDAKYFGNTDNKNKERFLNFFVEILE